MKLNLLPRKEFEITIEDGTVIKGQYSLWSIKRFCDLKGLSLSKLGDAMSLDNLSFDDLCSILLCAVEYKCRKTGEPFRFTDVDACEWIEWLGGIEGEDYIRLSSHASSDLDEKKNPVTQSSGESLSESSTAPV